MSEIWQQTIFMIAYLAVPFFFLIRIWRHNHVNLSEWLSEVILYGVYIIAVYIIGFWLIPYGYFFRYFLLISFFVATFKSLRNTKRNLKPLTIKQAFTYLSTLSISGFLMIGVFFALNGFFSPPGSVDLEFPHCAT